MWTGGHCVPPHLPHPKQKAHRRPLLPVDPMFQPVCAGVTGRVKGEINSLQCPALDSTLGLGGCVGRKDALGSTPRGQALGCSAQKGLQLQ